jgi:hypothetical protein
VEWIVMNKKMPDVALDPAKGTQLLARAQAAIAAPPKQILVATSPREAARSRAAIAPAPKKMRLSVSRRPKSGKWVCVICGVPGCMFAPRWVDDE